MRLEGRGPRTGAYKMPKPLDLTNARILVSNDDGIAAPGIKISGQDRQGALVRCLGRGPGNRTERRESLAHHPSAVARAQARPQALRRRRHADRCGAARDQPHHEEAQAHAVPLRCQSRRQHGRGRALFRHRRRGDGSDDAGREIDCAQPVHAAPGTAEMVDRRAFWRAHRPQTRQDRLVRQCPDERQLPRRRR